MRKKGRSEYNEFVSETPKEFRINGAKHSFVCMESSSLFVFLKYPACEQPLIKGRGGEEL